MKTTKIVLSVVLVLGFVFGLKALTPTESCHEGDTYTDDLGNFYICKQGEYFFDFWEGQRRKVYSAQTEKAAREEQLK